jgi:3-(3-hydroxy-phenyl)propionate hydroxylase
LTGISKESHEESHKTDAPNDFAFRGLLYLRMNLETEVFIAGLGPVGGALAGLLAQWGVSTIVVERETEIYRLPRAAHFDHEIMRIFQQLGIVDEIRDHVRPLDVYEFRAGSGEVLMRFDQKARSTVSGWAPSYMFHQPAMEQALRERLAREPLVTVSTGHQLTAISRNDDRGVEAVVSEANGSEYHVRARFMVGADGGASTARRLAGIGLFDYGFEEPWIVIDTIATDEEGLPPHGVQICDPRRPTTVMPMSLGRRRWEFMLLPGERAEDMLHDARIAELMRGQVRPGQVEVVRKAVYVFHGLVARQWRAGSILLAGDAAHQMPPFMGQGMCSGLRDAANLAWKLALVVKDSVDASLLDTYQLEREPHVRHIIERAIEMGRIICTLDPDAARARDQRLIADGRRAGALPGLPGIGSGFLSHTARAGELFPQPFARLADNRTGRLDDLMGHEFLLMSRSLMGMIAELPYLKIVQLGKDIFDDGTIEGWLAKADAEAVVVRPDRYVFGTGSPSGLVDELRTGLERGTSG